MIETPTLPPNKQFAPETLAIGRFEFPFGLWLIFRGEVLVSGIVSLAHLRRRLSSTCAAVQGPFFPLGFNFGMFTVRHRRGTCFPSIMLRNNAKLYPSKPTYAIVVVVSTKVPANCYLTPLTQNHKCVFI